MKVLIVDDEFQACEGMVNRVKRMNFTQVDEISYVTDAREAIERVEKEPESSWLIITDIQMPGMDGLKMIQTMQAKLIHAHFIVFSAHKEFEYAKEALRLGVVEYLLKPCRYEELRATVAKILESLEYRQRQEKKAEKKLHALLHAGEEKQELLEDLENLLGKLNMTSFESYSVISLYPDVSQIRSFETLYPMLRLNKGMEILVNHPQDVQISDVIRISRDAWAGVSTKGRPIEIRRMLQEARCALKNRILMPPGTVIRYENVRQEGNNQIMSQLLSRQLNAELIRQGEAAVIRAVNEIFSQEYQKELDVSSLKKLFVMLKGALHALKLELMVHGEFVDKDFREFESVEEMKQYIIEAYCALARELKEVEEETVVVQYAKEYVRKNLDKEINMTVIANRFNMNYYYFSRLFRSVTGETFSQYILKIRMQVAAEQLSSGASIQEAAEKTGYLQVKNFSRAFHNCYGMTPSEWKKRQENRKGERAYEKTNHWKEWNRNFCHFPGNLGNGRRRAVGRRG